MRVDLPKTAIAAKLSNTRDAPEADARAPIAEALVTGLPSTVLIRRSSTRGVRPGTLVAQDPAHTRPLSERHAALIEPPRQLRVRVPIPAYQPREEQQHVVRGPRRNQSRQVRKIVLG
jgi:hypothetical protein